MLLWSRCRSILLRSSRRHGSAWRSGSAATARWSSSIPPLLQHLQPDEIAAFTARGVLDDQGLTKFQTLHEMQVHACQVFAKKPLFGTYSNATGKFEYETYQQFGQQVQECVKALQHLGT
jgi:hypothetical protein